MQALMIEVPIICIDGPSGAGKGTVAHMLAAELGWHLLDSGSLYRVTAFACLHDGVGLEDENSVAEVARHLDVRFEQAPSGEVLVYYRDVDASRAIRTEEGGRGASTVGAMPAVREALLQRQRDFAQAPGLVADGRDMGTVVFPDAVLKIYLTASPEVRAERRYKQLIDKGIDVNLASLVEELRLRDERDMNREVAPLKPAADAIVVDTSKLDIQQVTHEVMLSLIHI